MPTSVHSILCDSYRIMITVCSWLDFLSVYAIIHSAGSSTYSLIEDVCTAHSSVESNRVMSKVASWHKPCRPTGGACSSKRQMPLPVPAVAHKVAAAGACFLFSSMEILLQRLRVVLVPFLIWHPWKIPLSPMSGYATGGDPGIL